MNYQTRVWIQRFTLITIVMPVILVVGFISAMLFMDFNQYKPELAKLISDKSGYETHINGDLSIGIWPFSLVIHDVTLKNPAGFVVENLVEAQALQVQLSLWSLFVDKKLRLKGVEIEGAILNLVTLANGHSNWLNAQKLAQTTQRLSNVASTDVTADSFKAGLRHASVSAAASSDQGGFWSFESLALHDVTIISTIYSENQDIVEQLTISHLDLIAFDVVPNQPFKSSLSFNLQRSDQIQSWEMDGLANVTVGERFKVWQFQDWSSNVRIALPPELEVPDMRFTSSGKTLLLDFAAQSWAIEKGEWLMSPATISFDAKGVWGKTSQLEGRVIAKALNIPRWLRHAGLAPLQFVNAAALTNVNGQFDFKSNATESHLRNLSLEVDGATLSGQIWRLHNTQELGFDLDINQLDMDTYAVFQKDAKPVVAPKTKGTASQQSKPKEGVLIEQTQDNNTYIPLALPIETLRALNANGQLTLGKLKIWQHRFEEVDIHIRANNGQIALAPLDAKLYEGQLQSKLLLDVSGTTPGYFWQGKIKDIALQQLLQEGWNNSQLSGKYEAFFDLKTQGVNEQLLKQNLNGVFSAAVKNGSFKGIDLNKLLATKPSGANDSTRFEQLSVTGKFTNGIYQIQKLNFDSERFKGAGFGQVDLNKAQINAQVNTLIVKPGQDLASLKGVQVPVKLSGPLNQIRWSVDVKGLLNNPGNQERLFKELGRFFNPS